MADAPAIKRPMKVWPLRRIILVSIVAYSLTLGGIFGWLTYRAARDIVREEILATVGVAASAKRQALNDLFIRRQQGVNDFLDGLPAICENEPNRLACMERELRTFERASNAIAGNLFIDDIEIPFGVRRDTMPRPYAGRSPSFHTHEGVLSYVVHAVRPPYAINICFAGTDVVAIFENREGLRKSGESFITDSRGYFLTPPRYETTQGRSHPIATGPMERCLAGEDGEALDLDYRGVPVVHGYRHVPILGGGCIMAHIDQDEALASARKVRAMTIRIALIVTLLSALVAYLASKFFTTTIESLSASTSAVAAGDFDAPVPLSGPEEVRNLGKAFQDMVFKLKLSREALEISNKDLEEFARVASHDLKAPLRTIIGFSERIEREPLSEKQKDCFARITRAAKRMELLIADILEYSRLTSAPRLPSVVNVESLVREIKKDLEAAILEKKAEIRAEALPNVHGDEPQIRQLFQNLISNSLKYAREGVPPLIAISARTLGHLAEFTIADNGVGFDEEQARKIFEPFTRLHREFEGTGIGLTICQRVVHRHGGTISAHGEPGEGATFVFTLPAA